MAMEPSERRAYVQMLAERIEANNAAMEEFNARWERR
ncbi:hypothetical protein NAEX_06868 [Nannocystis exedens]|nr:hypothetical protein NAEX_06868 [Nannocystis exedens]